VTPAPPAGEVGEAGGQQPAGAPVLRALDMLECLAGHVIDGLPNKDLAAAMRCPPPYVTRTAAVLIARGWVEKDPSTERFRLTPRFGRLAFRVMADFDRAKNALEQLQRNYLMSH